MNTSTFQDLAAEDEVEKINSETLEIFFIKGIEFIFEAMDTNIAYPKVMTLNFLGIT